MKKIILLVVVLLLCGCANTNFEIHSSLNTLFSNSEPCEYRQNNFTKYMDYYVPSDLLEDDFNNTSVTFSYNTALINMNINVQNIINDRYYVGINMSDEGYIDESKVIFSSGGQFINANEINTSFFVKLYQINEYYFYILKTQDVSIYAKCLKQDLLEVGDKIFILAKTVIVDKELVLSDYMDKDVIDYEKKAIELFDTKMPESGIINDLILNNEDEPIEEVE